ncbi:MAG: ThuA domain-containing protein [SAR202 cluster bacterium]|nr:ThuA domain-containing protein [SAR202 cluster bacterium]
MNLLVISGGEHPYHESTPALADFLRGDGHEVMATEDASVLASDGMGAYDVLIFNTRRSGDLTLAEDEQAALTRSVGDGKGFVAIHCGASRPETWHEFHDVTGGGGSKLQKRWNSSSKTPASSTRDRRTLRRVQYTRPGSMTSTTSRARRASALS